MKKKKKKKRRKTMKVRFSTGHTRTTRYSSVASNIECEITEFCTMRAEFRGWGGEGGLENILIEVCYLLH